MRDKVHILYNIEKMLPVNEPQSILSENDSPLTNTFLCLCIVKMLYFFKNSLLLTIMATWWPDKGGINPSKPLGDFVCLNLLSFTPIKSMGSFIYRKNDYRYLYRYILKKKTFEECRVKNLCFSQNPWHLPTLNILLV